jgi:hypothetical protein
MKYYLCLDNREYGITSKSNLDNPTYFYRDWRERRKFLFEIFNQRFINAKHNSDFILLKTCYPNISNITIFVGHLNSVATILHKHSREFLGQKILIVSCVDMNYKMRVSRETVLTLNDILKNARVKAVYIPKNAKLLDYNDGKLYGFKFNITETEIEMYNNRNLDIEHIINKSFDLLI